MKNGLRILESAHEHLRDAQHQSTFRKGAVYLTFKPLSFDAYHNALIIIERALIQIRLEGPQ